MDKNQSRKPTAIPISENRRGKSPMKKHSASNKSQAIELFKKLQCLRHILESNPMGCDAKWTLFVAAASSYAHSVTLKPYPMKFSESHYTIDELLNIINDVPKLDLILKNIVEKNYEDLNLEVVDLLYWVLLMHEEPALVCIEDQKEICEIMKTTDTNDQQLPVEAASFIFEVISSTGCPSKKNFKCNTEEQPVKLGFYGNKLEYFYSFLHKSCNESSSFTELNTSIKIACDRSPSCPAWGASQCGAFISCVAICEYASNEDAKNFSQSAGDNDFREMNKINCPDVAMRLRYLLFYSQTESTEKEPQQEHQVGKRKRRSFRRKIYSFYRHHKYFFSLSFYAILFALIAYANRSDDAGRNQASSFARNTANSFIDAVKSVIYDKFQTIVSYLNGNMAIEAL